jgi:3-deoxy-D-manno-octulosonic-acid transferase
MGIGRDIAYGVGAVATAPLWGASLLRTGKWRTDWAGRFGRAGEQEDRRAGDQKRLLLYGVSVGEVNLIRQLVEQLEQAAGVDEQTSGGVELVIAASTNTGFARAEALYGGRHAVVRFPYDFSFAVRRFLDAVRPDAVGLVELEVWPNFVEACGQRGIPVAVLNGRLSERSFRRYRKVRRWVAPSFGRLSAVAAQSESYAERFVALGTPAERVRVLDTMKWDTAVVEDTVEGADALAAEMGIDRDRPLVVAGSTAPGEERLIVEGCPAGTQVLIAPRKPEWFEAVVKAYPGAVRRTGGRRMPSVGFRGEGEKKVFLLDTIGELRAAYSLAEVCVVGRSFTGELYGSDMMEPIALGKPTVIGPYHADFAETMRALSAAGGIVVAADPGEAVTEFLNNPTLAAEVAAAGREVIRARQGATERHRDLLLDLLNRSTI